MHRRLHQHVAPLGLLLMSCGCVQMTRHSNMVVFGTNTSVGVRVGTSATSVPEVQLGYSRQEAVVMPLVANTGSQRLRGTTEDVLVPCDFSQPLVVSGNARYVVHPCSLVAVRGEALDSYSVLASFGANFSGSGGTQNEASVGLAQYFATGMAAQLLAFNGGAAVVAVSEAAREASETRPTAEETRLMFGNETAFEAGRPVAAAYPAFRTRLIALVDATGSDADVLAKITSFETNAGLNTVMRNRCATKDGCLTAIRADDYAQSYALHRVRMDSAINSW